MSSVTTDMKVREERSRVALMRTTEMHPQSQHRVRKLRATFTFYPQMLLEETQIRAQAVSSSQHIRIQAAT